MRLIRGFGGKPGRSANARCFLCSLLLSLVVECCATAPASNRTDQSSSATSPTLSEVVNKLVEHNQERANRLMYYTSQRHYHLEYKGFPHAAEASMDVEATYSAPVKTFRVIAESGSRGLINHVLKKLLKGEQEAAAEQRDNALIPENYNFALLETTTENGRVLYVLQVEPKAAKKFLYRGRIWVDGSDYAVVRLEAEPCENPSFWIRNTEIRHSYGQVGEFWLPRQSTTVTKVRLGGTAKLTIDFERYDFRAASDQKPQPLEGRSIQIAPPAFK